MQNSSSDTERKVMAILKVLSESSEPLGSITIARPLDITLESLTNGVIPSR